jgi:T5SS/PEP-CTERM-associated repeat protein
MNTCSCLPVGFAAKILLLTLLFALALAPVARAQLVADGASATLNNVTNSVTGPVIVGTNGSFTQLTLTNGALLTNTLDGFIGLNTAAKSNTVWLTGTGTRWRMGQNLLVGNNGAFNRLVISNGALATCRLGYLGYEATASNNVVMVTGTNSSLTSTNSYIGIGGSGNQLVISAGGQVTNVNAQIGNNSSNNLVTVTGPGSRWANNWLIVGLARNGNHLVVSDGATVSSATDVNVSWWAYPATSTNNRVTVDGGNLLITNSAGSGKLDIFNGTTLFNAGLIAADSLLVSNSNSRFEFNGGTLITRGGSISNGQDFVIGPGADSPPPTWVVLSNATPTTIAGQLVIGAKAANASLFITNGATVTCSNASASTIAGSSRVVVSGPNSRWHIAQSLSVGQGGAGQLFITNGASLVTASCDLGSNVASSLQVSGENARWTNNGVLRVGVNTSGSSLLIGTDGIVANSSNLVIGALSGVGNAVEVNGGTLLVGGMLEARRGSVHLESGTVSASSLLAGPDGSVVFNGGTLSVKNCTVSNGHPFTVGSGSSIAIYQLTGNGLHTFNNGLVLANNGVLRGNGTVSGTLTAPSDSVIYPGDHLSLGRLVLSNSPALGAGLIMDISKNGTTLTNDQIQVAAPLTYAGYLSVNKSGPTPLANGDSFKLFAASSYTGAFSTLYLPAPPAGLMWTNQLLVNGTIAVVPETQPKISNVTRSGPDLILNVTGGHPGAEATIWTATNAALPMASWKDLSLHRFDWIGNLTITKAINPAEPQRYFRIMVGAEN